MAIDPGWGRTVMTWTGWDGTVWEITDPTQRVVVDYVDGRPQPPRSIVESGVFIVNQGVRGLSMPPIQRYTSESPVVAGSRYRGSRTQEREVFWPLVIASDESSAIFKARERAFFKTLRPGTTGTWTVISPDGEQRHLTLRFKDDGDATHDRDPSFYGVATYGITLVAERPYWEGQLIQRRWGLGNTVGFFSGPGIINISKGQSLDAATISNPGDVEAFPVWTLGGSFTSATVGIGGDLIEVPFGLASDRKVVIDTRPDHLTAYEYAVADTTLTGAYVDRTDDLGDVVFAAIPPGDNQTLAITVNGATTQAFVTADLTPQYYRAW